MEAHERKVRLRDGEVLVIAGVGDDRLALLGHRSARAPRQVVALLGRDPLDRGRTAQFEVAAVGCVELRRGRVGGSRAVEGVEVEARRARLEQLRGGHALAEHHVGLVEREVVVDELAEVRVAGRDLRRPAAPAGHRRGDLPPVGGRELAPRSVGPHPREAERRRRRGCRERGSERLVATLAALREQAFAYDVIAFRAMVVHGASCRREIARARMR